MQYFTQDFIDFFTELKNNNNREWFNENKQRYIKSVKEPFEAFVQDMIYRIHEDDETLTMTGKESAYRIYRDVRFSKDKTPYKTQASAFISSYGKKNYTMPAVYLEFRADEIRYYTGVHDLSKNQLQAVREFITSNIDEFNSLINDKDFKKKFGKIIGEQHKRIPKEFQDVHLKQPLIANKQFYYFAKFDGKKILSKTLPNQLMKCYYAAKPLNEFFKEALH